MECGGSATAFDHPTFALNSRNTIQELSPTPRCLSLHATPTRTKPPTLSQSLPRLPSDRRGPLPACPPASRPLDVRSPLHAHHHPARPRRQLLYLGSPLHVMFRSSIVGAGLARPSDSSLLTLWRNLPLSLFQSLIPANLFALTFRNLAKNSFARAISFAICAFNSSGPPNFFSSRNFFQNRTSILFGAKFPE